MELEMEIRRSIISADWPEVKRVLQRTGLNNFKPDEEGTIQEYLLLCRQCRSGDITKGAFYKSRDNLLGPLGEEFFDRRGVVLRTINDVLLPIKPPPVSIRRV